MAPPQATPTTSLSNLTTDVPFRGGSAHYQRVETATDVFHLITDFNAFHRPRGLDAIFYDADTDSFELSIEVIAAPGFFVQSFGPGDIVAADSNAFVTVYERDGDRLVLTNPGDPDLDLQSVASVGWSTDNLFTTDTSSGPGDVSDVRGFTVFGFETPFANMPNDGDATYTLKVFGVLIDSSAANPVPEELGGSGSLAADFGTGLVTISLTIERIDSTGASTVWDTASGQGVILVSPTGGGSNSFSGVIARTGAAAIGAVENFSGAFFGVNAEEVGGIFTFPSHFAAGGEEAFGSFLGATSDVNTPRPGLNSSLASLMLSEIFTAYGLSTYVQSDGSGFFLETRTYQGVAYDATADTYYMPVAGEPFAPVSLAKLGVATLTPATFSAGASDATKAVHLLDNPSSAIDDVYTLYTPGSASPYALDYTAIGVWSNEDMIPLLGVTPLNAVPLTTQVVYGQRAPAADVPTSGSAVYNLAAIGSHYEPQTLRTLVGAGTLGVNFAGSGSFDLDLTLSFDDAGVITPWHVFEETGAGNFLDAGPAFGSKRFLFQIEAVDDQDVVGAIEGGFFGPGAQEIGGVFRIQEFGASALTQHGVGAFVGERQP
jgi:hypothetical protein